MKPWPLLLCFSAVCGCGLGTSPRTLYLRALHQKLTGNAEAYYDGMLALGQDAPDSRAGRRARATVVGDDRLADLLLVGLGAGFFNGPDAASQARAEAKEADALLDLEAQTQLGLIASAQKLFHREHGRYCVTFAECDTPPPAAAHYFYLLSSQTVSGGSDSEQTVDLEEAARAYLEARDITPRVTSKGFLAVAIGTGAEPDEFDIWTIDEAEHLVHLTP